MNDQMNIIYGPVVPGPQGRVIYSVTLGNGYVVTSPEGFGRDTPPPPDLSEPYKSPAAPRPITG